MKSKIEHNEVSTLLCNEAKETFDRTIFTLKIKHDPKDVMKIYKKLDNLIKDITQGVNQ